MNFGQLKRLSVACILTCYAGCSERENAVPSASDREPAKMIAPLVQDLEADSSTVDIVTPGTVPIYSRDIAPLFDQYCLRCHDSSTAEGGVVLDVFGDQDLDPKCKSLLLRVADNLRTATMPPEGEPRPNAKELETINSWLDRSLPVDNRGGERVTVRRLNRGV